LARFEGDLEARGARRQDGDKEKGAKAAVGKSPLMNWEGGGLSSRGEVSLHGMGRLSIFADHLMG